MNRPSRLFDRRLAFRLQLPAALLIALLQRTLIPRAIDAATSLFAATPSGVLLRSAAAAAATLGAIDSVAGATTLVATQPSPTNATVGEPITPIAFTVTDTINLGTWQLGGSLPPGLKVVSTQGGAELTGPGTLNALSEGEDDGYGGTTGGVGTTLPLLQGTPTQAGNYTITLQASQPPGLSDLSTSVFSYSINVAAAAQTSTPPTFTTQPAPQSVIVGTSLTLSAAASGSPVPTYEWQKDGTAIGGATAATYTLASVQPSDAGTYTVVATNSAGAITSTAVTVAVTNPTGDTAPAIARQPVAQTIASGSTVVFTTEVSGTPAPAIQWMRDGTPVAGVTSRVLVIPGATAANAGRYAAVATNASGTATTSEVNLVVNDEPKFGHLINLSIRTALTASEPSFTLGTFVGGTGTSGVKPLVVRAVGPTLAAFGIGTALPDAKLDILSGNTVVEANDNWGGSGALSSAFAQVGAFPLADAAAKDAAVYKPDFATGPYTVQVAGVGGALGEVIAEPYDATPNDAFSASTPRLINVSVLKRIETGSSLTADFYVGGNTSRTVLVRAIGPGLAAFGLADVMPDPQVSLYSGSQQIAGNDNWGGDTQLTTAGNGVGAFPITDAASKDAILLITLSPGAYTVQVGGIGGGGSVIVELYEVP